MKNIVKCPYCGAEYLPAEIYMPDYFIGRPEDIQKNEKGKIINVTGEDMELVEHYRCDYCDRKFTITATVKFNTDSKTKDFDNEHTTKLSKPGLFLNED